MSQVVWLRNDLRLEDNPAIHFAAQKGPVLLICTPPTGRRPDGKVTKWWRAATLNALNESLAPYEGNLLYSDLSPLTLFRKLRETHPTVMQEVHWNRLYEKEAIEADSQIKEFLTKEGIEVHTYNGALLIEPWKVETKQKTFFKVFTPFWKRCLEDAERFPAPLPAPSKIQFTPLKDPSLFAPLPTSHPPFARCPWTPGEKNAKETLASFLETKLSGYGTKRDIPAENNVSGLSPYLKIGAISPRQIWSTALQETKATDDRKKFLTELGWREFSYHLLYHFPKLGTTNFQSNFSQFPWRKEEAYKKDLKAWQQGKTGYPLVDAGIRELNQTGFMHNRVRMVVASFLIKNLLIPWQVGERYFWEHLLDADPASNTASWQWVAGSGADAAPYFRIFNPLLQSKKFDPHGRYIKKWIPELKDISEKQSHAPWESKQAHTYPPPLVDLKATRERALQAYAHVKEK